MKLFNIILGIFLTKITIFVSACHHDVDQLINGQLAVVQQGQTAIDDFGAGYSGLNLLADFQPDLIKLDMALIRDVDQDRARQAIVRGVVMMCSELNVTVIAEGIVQSVKDSPYRLRVSRQTGFA